MSIGTADDAALAAAEALAEKATPGPWLTDARVPGVVVFTQNLQDDYVIATCRKDRAKECSGAMERYGEPTPFVDSAFIAAAREGWPKAVAIARRLQAENRELRESLTKLIATARNNEQYANVGISWNGFADHLEAAIADAGKESR